jgi:hypothetical protein
MRDRVRRDASARTALSLRLPSLTIRRPSVCCQAFRGHPHDERNETGHVGSQRAAVSNTSLLSSDTCARCTGRHLRCGSSRVLEVKAPPSDSVTNFLTPEGRGGVETFTTTHPRIEEKLVDVVGLYMNPPSRTVVFSFNEKTYCQALDRTQPSLPMKGAPRRHHDPRLQAQQNRRHDRDPDEAAQKLYLATVIDLNSRRLLGTAMGLRPDTESGRV